MSVLANYVKTGDWKGEKHVPAIKLPSVLKKDEEVTLEVVVGEAVSHPNTMEHYIGWIKVFFVPEGGSLAVELCDAAFKAHGEGGAFTAPAAVCKVKFPGNGKVIAQSYCNIHGLWENSVDIVLQ